MYTRTTELASALSGLRRSVCANYVATTRRGRPDPGSARAHKPELEMIVSPRARCCMRHNSSPVPL